MSDLYDLKVHLLSDRELMQMLLNAYTLGVAAIISEEVKGKDAKELKKSIEPLLYEIIYQKGKIKADSISEDEDEEIDTGEPLSESWFDRADEAHKRSGGE